MAIRPHSAARTLYAYSRSLSRLAAVLVFAGSVCVAPWVYARGLPVQEGILNYGKISERLYRGAQPSAEAIKNLKQLGVKLIINLRMPGEAWKEEAALAEASGIQYTNFPMNGSGRPNEQQVRQILALFETAATPVFVHCLHGCDRTGTIVACYRIQHDHWSADLALREAKTYGISWLEFRMKRFVVSFGRPTKPDVRQARAS